MVVEARRVCAAAGQKGRNFSCTSKDGSCGPKKHASGKKRVLAGGIEPTTLGLLDPRSDQLSYASDVSGRRRGRSEAPPNAPLAAHREKPRGLTLDGEKTKLPQGNLETATPTCSDGGRRFVFLTTRVRQRTSNRKHTCTTGVDAATSTTCETTEQRGRRTMTRKGARRHTKIYESAPFR